MNSLSLFIYNLSIRIYSFGIFLASPLNAKAKLFLEGRKNLLSELEKTIPKKEKIIWMHCASVGEFEQGKPVLKKLKQEFPSMKIVLTFFSPSGYEQRNKIHEADFIFYLPIDTKRNAEGFIRLVNPHLAIFVKYEFWFHYLNELQKKNIPSILISAIFRRDQFFFKWYGKAFQKILHSFKMIFVQDENSELLLKEIGVKNFTLSSDTRFDRVLELKNEAKQFPAIEKFCTGSNVLVAGSTWKEDEKILLHYIQHHPDSKLKWIIAPHEINEAHIEELKKQLGEKAIRYSELLAWSPLMADDPGKTFLIIDNIGMLSSLYRYAKIAYVGGGFGKGIHNILEAAVNGVPVLFGTNFKKFKEANDLVTQKFCFTVQNENDFTQQLNRFLSDEKYLLDSSFGCSQYVIARAGATVQVVKYCKTIVEK